MRYVGGAIYGTPAMLPWIFLIELPMILLLAYVTKRSFSFEQVGLGQAQKKGRWADLALVILPITFAILLLGYWLTQLSPFGRAHLNLGVLTLGILGVGLVGISEEWMFRGVILHHFASLPQWQAALSHVWKNLIARSLARYDWSSAATQAAGIATNAMLFSLLHAFNLIGGYSPSAVAYQMIGTVALGVVFGALACWLPSIRPLMAWHFLWDYFVFVGNYFHTLK